MNPILSIDGLRQPSNRYADHGAEYLLANPSEQLVSKLSTISKAQHQELSNQVKAILDSDTNWEFRALDSEIVADIILSMHDGTYESSSGSCSSVFNMQGGNVLLYPNDDLAYANTLCPGGSTFILLPGTHYGHTVINSKSNNTWTAYTSAVMHGQNSRRVAFDDPLNNNTFQLFEIKNYTEFGVHSNGTQNIYISTMAFRNIASNKNGADFGAVDFVNSENITVIGSIFNKVASSIRFEDSEGPLRVLQNEALDTGRNFVQCIRCSGGNIRINNNSLEHNQQYGSVPLEDFINIFSSNGLSSDYIQVNNNRARINNISGVSSTGSFIILGDIGGMYQIAKNNIGVTTGNVGIGAAGGVDIEVIDNKMYSAQNSISNVAFYSLRIPKTSTRPCGGHIFSGNLANWTNANGVLNKASAPTNNTSDQWCGLTNSEINHSSRVKYDSSLGPGIWNTW